MTTNEEAAVRVSAFCETWKQFLGKDPELIYSLHLGTDREVELRIADLEALAALTTPQDGGDALEARQPSGDDRAAQVEAAMRACIESADIPTGMRADLVAIDGVAVIRERVDLQTVVEVILSAAVPDAATEELERAHDLIELREFEIDNLGELITELRAERDAALAAIERCRGVIASWKSVQASNREQFESGNPGMIVPIDCVGGLSVALDGAPEPEWEEPK